jgi:hypothetical protein
MTNLMNNFIEYDDESQDSSQPPDASYMTFPGQVGNYEFSGILPQDTDLPLQNFGRSQPPDLEGRMSNVMLNYGIPTSGVSMPMNLDITNAFAYNVPTSYPPTMAIPPMDHSQFQPTYPAFTQTMPLPRYPQQAGPLAGPLSRNEYDTGTDSANFEDSDFSGRTSDRSQVQPRSQRQPERRLQPAGQPYRPSQPVAIQPKKPLPAKGELCLGHSSPLTLVHGV